MTEVMMMSTIEMLNGLLKGNRYTRLKWRDETKFIVRPEESKDFYFKLYSKDTGWSTWVPLPEDLNAIDWVRAVFTKNSLTTCVLSDVAKASLSDVEDNCNS